MDPLLFVGLVIMPFAVVWSIRRQIRNERERAARTIYVVHKRQSRRRAWKPPRAAKPLYLPGLGRPRRRRS